MNICRWSFLLGMLACLSLLLSCSSGDEASLPEELHTDYTAIQEEAYRLAQQRVEEVTQKLEEQHEARIAQMQEHYEGRINDHTDENEKLSAEVEELRQAHGEEVAQRWRWQNIASFIGVFLTIVAIAFFVIGTAMRKSVEADLDQQRKDEQVPQFDE